MNPFKFNGLSLGLFKNKMSMSHALEMEPHFWMKPHENTFLPFVIQRPTRDKPLTYFEPTAETLASDQAGIYYQLISHPCFVQFYRNVELNDNLQLRSQILVNVFCFHWLVLPLHQQNVLGWKISLDCICFSLLTAEKSDD